MNVNSKKTEELLKESDEFYIFINKKLVKYNGKYEKISCHNYQIINFCTKYGEWTVAAVYSIDNEYIWINVWKEGRYEKVNRLSPRIAKQYCKYQITWY
jgi:hypothetical protein